MKHQTHRQLLICKLHLLSPSPLLNPPCPEKPLPLPLAPPPPPPDIPRPGPRPCCSCWVAICCIPGCGIPLRAGRACRRCATTLHSARADSSTRAPTCRSRMPAVPAHPICWLSRCAPTPCPGDGLPRLPPNPFIESSAPLGIRPGACPYCPICCTTTEEKHERRTHMRLAVQWDHIPLHSGLAPRAPEIYEQCLCLDLLSPGADC